MQINKYIPISIAILLVLGLTFLAGYRYAYNNYANKNLRDTVTIFKYDTTYIAGDKITLRDTLKKTKTIRDSIFIPNPMDSLLYAKYDALVDSLSKLNVTVDLKVDTLINTQNRTDSLSIVCNTIKRSVSFDLRYGFTTQIIPTKETKIYLKDFQWGTFVYGGVTGLLTYYILTTFIK